MLVQVVASTFDAFVDAVQSVRETLPVVTSEIGDVWLQGISSDPLKEARYRAFARARAACIKVRSWSRRPACLLSYVWIFGVRERAFMLVCVCVSVCERDLTLSFILVGPMQ